MKPLRWLLRFRRRPPVEANIRRARSQVELPQARVRELERKLLQAEQALQVERTVTRLYEQFIKEIARDNALVPGVWKPVTQIAARECLSWVQEGRGDLVHLASMAENAAATLSNRLLPEPDRSGDKGGVVTERQRWGMAGDSPRPARPGRFHAFQWLGSVDREQEGRRQSFCGLAGCGSALDDPIHRPPGSAHDAGPRLEA